MKSAFVILHVKIYDNTTLDLNQIVEYNKEMGHILPHRIFTYVFIH